MKVIKRSGAEVNFDITKIIAAIGKANNTVEPAQQMSAECIREIANSVEAECTAMNRAVSVEEIQDMVELAIMAKGHHHVAKNYITYRYTRSLVRKNNTTDDKILSLIERSNEEVKQENANKNPVINSTQRDYMAGEVSRDLTERILLPKEIVEAHREGIIHFHDSDYYAHHMHNCFTEDTSFITGNGPMRFSDCYQGQRVIILAMDATWREGYVRYHGKQLMFDVVLKDGENHATVTCTRDHRWILRDGSVTTNLSVGDKLWVLPAQEPLIPYGNKHWTVESITPHGDEPLDAWCLEVPDTHSFTLVGGIVTGNCDLVNLDDMLQNGTVITNTMIERPRSFATACNIATQIVAQVASNQYGLSAAVL